MSPVGLPVQTRFCGFWVVEEQLAWEAAVMAGSIESVKSSVHSFIFGANWKHSSVKMEQNYRPSDDTTC